MSRQRGCTRGSHWRLATLLILPMLAGCADTGVPDWTRAGEFDRAPALMREYGCQGCHVIPGVHGARGRVGPSLAGVGSRAYIAGVIVNTPDNLAHWVHAPQRISPRTAMPDVGVSEADAAVIAAFLGTLR